jgi:hypothetical protein
MATESGQELTDGMRFSVFRVALKPPALIQVLVARLASSVREWVTSSLANLLM